VLGCGREVEVEKPLAVSDAEETGEEEIVVGSDDV